MDYMTKNIQLFSLSPWGRGIKGEGESLIYLAFN